MRLGIGSVCKVGLCDYAVTCLHDQWWTIHLLHNCYCLFVFIGLIGTRGCIKCAMWNCIPMKTNSTFLQKTINHVPQVGCVWGTFVEELFLEADLPGHKPHLTGCIFCGWDWDLASGDVILEIMLETVIQCATTLCHVLQESFEKCRVFCICLIHIFAWIFGILCLIHPPWCDRNRIDVMKPPVMFV